MACDEQVLQGHSATGGRSFYNVTTLLIVISIFTLSVDALLKPFVDGARAVCEGHDG
jgi:hypothetical protein